MTDHEGPRDAEIIDLEAFRNKIQAKIDPATVSPDMEWHPVGPRTFQLARRMLAGLDARPPVLAIIERTNQAPQDVKYLGGEDTGWFAVNRNEGVATVLRGELETYDPATATKLGPAVDDFYTLSLVARSVIQRKRLIKNNAAVPDPVIGTERVNLDSSARKQNVNTWRTAAGIGVAAVTSRQPSFRRDITVHLRDAFTGRMAYETSLARVGWLLGRPVPADAQLTVSGSPTSDPLLGLCTPLNDFEVRKIMNPKDS